MTEEQPKEQTAAEAPSPKIIVSSSEGVAMADPDYDPTEDVGEPAKVMRIGTMIKQLLDEVKAEPLDLAARETLAGLHARSIAELKSALSDDLAEELDRIVIPLQEAPSEAELRIAHAQLVGWLEGLFHGIQTALVAQQMIAQNQLSSMRRALPPGLAGERRQRNEESPERQERPGQYL